MVHITRVASVFDTIYGRLPSEQELAHIYAFSDADDTTGAAILFRRIIGMHERNQYPTPFLVRFGPEDLQYQQFEGVELATDLADHSVSRIINHEIAFSPDVVAFLRRELRPGMTFLDIGANIGVFTMLGAHLVGPEGKVIAFEPYSENCRLILLSADRNGFANVKLHPVALGRETGSAYFSPALGSNAGFMAQTRNQLLNPQCIVVPVERLDALAPARVDVVKIDVEGAEAMVFEGATDLLTKARPVICAEFSVSMIQHNSGVDPGEYLRRIRAFGYNISRVDPSNLQEVAIPDISKFLEDFATYGPILDLTFRPE